jgi:hypothetical protein
MGQMDTPVLGKAPFGDVQLGHDFDTRGDGGAQGKGRGLHLVQDAVDAVTAPQGFFVRLDMDVAGSGPYGFRHEKVYQPDHGGGRPRGFQLGDIHILFFFQHEFQVAVGSHVVDDFLHFAAQVTAGA